MSIRVLPRLPKPSILRGFAWIVTRVLAADKSYRDRRALARMPEERLRDMGLDCDAFRSIR